MSVGRLRKMLSHKRKRPPSTEVTKFSFQPKAQQKREAELCYLKPEGQVREVSLSLLQLSAEAEFCDFRTGWFF